MVVVDQNTVAVDIYDNSLALVDIQQNHVKYIRKITMPYSLGTSFINIENEFYISNEFDIVVTDLSGSVKTRITLSFTPCDMFYGVDSQRFTVLIETLVI